jgi:hypothetical protein
MGKRGIRLHFVSYVSILALAGITLMGCESDYSVSVHKSAASLNKPAQSQTPSPSPTPSHSPSPSPSPSVICDPLGGSGGSTSGSMVNGITGKLYYLDAGNPSGYSTTDEYIQYGHSPDGVTFIFNQLNVPTYSFDRGFQLPDGSYLQDSQGNKLTSYFGFHFTTTITLGSDDTDGLYQFGTLSDDGTSVRIVKPYGTLDSLIEDEGSHGTHLECATRAIPMDSTTRMPVEINWHQGPPFHVAIMLIWRKVSGTSASLQDNYCGVSSISGGYFDPSTVPSTPGQGWLDLQAHGWKVLAPSNFLMPGNQTNHCSKI